jgi:hypothetical protein
VLSLLAQARIVTTTGTVEFCRDGTRREHAREKTAAGSRFEGVVRMTRAETEQALADMRLLLPPADVVVTLNGERIPAREPLATFQATLPTVIADDEGVLRTTRRATDVAVHEPLPGEAAMIFELGIPVVETGDRFHVDIGQKVPLNIDRDNVPPAFLQAVRTAVLNHTAHLLSGDDATQAWVDHALRDGKVSEAAVQTVIRERFGEKVVAADPSDREAMNRAVANGYTVLAGGALDREQWANVRRAAVAPPAGRIFPTPRPYSDAPDAAMARAVPEAEWSDGMRAVAALARRLARDLMGVAVRVTIVREMNANACYGASTTHGGVASLDFNLGALGRRFFDEVRTPAGLERVLDLLLDEFAHETEANHLSADYFRALRRLGAGMTRLALTRPALFGLDGIVADGAHPGLCNDTSAAGAQP